MAPHKNLPSQQTVIQARAASLILIHRESISIDNSHTVPRASITMSQHRQVMSAYNATLPLSTPPQHHRHPHGDEGAASKPYNGWMTKFCVEPPDDVDTCCLGCWVPCVLYGKTHWRLKQVSKGEDATDSKWKSKDGCNAPCWAWWGVSSVCCITVPISGVLTGIQRAQIRGTYGVKGNCASDLALGIFCPGCTQIQNDREVRAREGDIKMRYNLQYLKGNKRELVSTEPKPAKAMAYAPSQQTPRLSLEHEMTAIQPINPKKSNKLQKKSNHKPTTTSGESKLDRHKCKPEKNKGSSARDAELKHQTQKATRTPTTPKVFVTQYQDQPPKPSALSTKPRDTSRPFKKVTIFGKSSQPGQPSIPEEPSQNPVGMLSQQHELIECTVIEAEEEIKGGPSKEAHILEESNTIEVECPGNENSTNLSQHTLVECTVIEEDVEEEAKLAIRQHRISDCETIVVDYTPTKPLEQHQLDDCDTIPAPEASVQAQELSYFHDFTDCPVDKAVLEYYESEEKKSQQHELSDCIRTSLPVELLQSNSPPQHLLADCSDEEMTPLASPSNHRSASYNLDRSKNKDDVVGGHRLSSCPTPPVLSHHVIENTRVNAIEDSQATQKPMRKVHHIKSKEKHCSDKAGESTDSMSSPDSGSNSQGSSENTAKADGAIIRRHRRRHKQNRKAFPFPVAAIDENQSARFDSARHSLEQVLASNSGKKEENHKGHELASKRSNEKIQKQKEIDSSAATMGETSGQKVGGIPSEDSRSLGVSQNGISGFWSKLTGSAANDKLDKDASADLD